MKKFLIIAIFGLLASGCTQQVKPTYALEYGIILQDQARLKMSVEIEFEDQSGVEEIKDNIKQVRFALYLLFSSHRAADLQNKRDILITLQQTFLRLLEAKINRVAFTDYAVLNA